ncbi:hypothetical protein Anas_01077 [Armadillidium nasatum]|uniref:Uncharacterized protein n=1 Tax=Armadillidium nasatum TaxID=96803 RepID=A0A5N5SSS5_9CRUS|nr:hypothetical protein Anas_01077 [Armadillidium nasatum]
MTFNNNIMLKYSMSNATSLNKRAFWLYINGYISIILIANCFFYFHLSYILIKARKFSENALGKKTQLHKEW